MKAGQGGKLGAAWLGCLVAAGCAPRNEFVAPPPPAVTVANPVQRDVTVYESFPGRLEAVDTIELRARVRGFLDEARFVDAELVEKNEVLFVIEQAPFIAEVQAAGAGLAQARATSDLKEADYRKKKEASASGAVSEIDVLASLAEYNVATSAVLAAEASLEMAQINLSYTEIRAPVSGRMGRALVSDGNLVGGVAETHLGTLVVEDPIYAFFHVNERLLLDRKKEKPRPDRISENQPPVTLELADGTRVEQTGTLDFLDNQVDDKAGTIQVRAVFPNPGGHLIPGMFARLLIPEERLQALLVPDAAIQRDLVGPYVLVVDDENVVQSKYVTPGPLVEGERIVDAGLEPGDRVIVSGLQRARPGAEVRPYAAEPPPPTPESAPSEGA